jgi:hypothetical protein
VRCLDAGSNRWAQQLKQSSRYVHPSDDAVLGAMERMGGKSGGHKIGHNAMGCGAKAGVLVDKSPMAMAVV